jgi:hypothetical protein
MRNCHNAALGRSRKESLRRKLEVSVSYQCAYNPHLLSTFPISPSGCGRPPLAACFFTSTSIEAFDDLNLWFGSRPRHWRFPSCCPCQPTTVAAVMNSGGSQTFYLSRSEVSICHLAANFFFLIGPYLVCDPPCSAFSFHLAFKETMNSVYKLNIRSCPHW